MIVPRGERNLFAFAHRLIDFAEKLLFVIVLAIVAVVDETAGEFVDGTRFDAAVAKNAATVVRPKQTRFSQVNLYKSTISHQLRTKLGLSINNCEIGRRVRSNYVIIRV